MTTHFIDTKAMRTLITTHDQGTTPHEGETFIIKDPSQPPVTAYREYIIQEVIHAGTARDSKGLTYTVCLALCVPKSDSRRTSQRMQTYLGALKK